MRNRMMWTFPLLGALLAVGAPQAQAAEIVGQIEADIPFAFHAGDAMFPAGSYVAETLDRSDPNVMEIKGVDGQHAAVLLVRSTQTAVTPTQSELVFNKYGDQYFLSKLFDRGYKEGAEVTESHYEKLVKKEGMKPENRRVPGHHGSGGPR